MESLSQSITLGSGAAHPQLGAVLAVRTMASPGARDSAPALHFGLDLPPVHLLFNNQCSFLPFPFFSIRRYAQIDIEVPTLGFTPTSSIRE